MPRRFTLAGLLLCVTFIGLILAIVVPLWRHTRRARMYADEIVAVAASADGSTFGALLGDGRVLVWDSEGALKATLRTLGTFGGDLALSFDGKLAAVSPAEPNTYANVEPHGNVQIWDIAQGEVRRTLPMRESALRFSPTEDSLLAFDGPPWRYEIHSAVDENPPRVLPRGTYPAFSPDGKRLAVGTTANKIQIYDIASSRLERELITDADAKVGYARVAWSPDGHAIAAEALQNGETETIERWDLATGRVRRVPLRDNGDDLARSGAYYTLKYSPDGRRLLIAAGGPGFKVLDSKTLEPVRTCEGHEQSLARRGGLEGRRVHCRPERYRRALGRGNTATAASAL
ncbi:MAG TPA: hypothetical protein VND64_09290 [Pirellulales bacterium]|nr:hypothetical protein [Pirellulales bacterium]